MASADTFLCKRVENNTYFRACYRMTDELCNRLGCLGCEYCDKGSGICYIYSTREYLDVYHGADILSARVCPANTSNIGNCLCTPEAYTRMLSTDTPAQGNNINTTVLGVVLGLTFTLICCALLAMYLFRRARRSRSLKGTYCPSDEENKYGTEAAHRPPLRKERDAPPDPPIPGVEGLI